MQLAHAPLWVSWALALGACGGQIDEREPSEGSPRAESPETTVVVPDQSPPPEDATPGGAVRDEPPRQDEPALTTEDSGPLGPVVRSLTEQCGACHGAETLARGSAGSFGCVEDVDCMVELGLLLPLDSRRSPVIVRMRDGSMPPRGVQPRPTTEDIDRLARLMDNPAYWP